VHCHFGSKDALLEAVLLDQGLGCASGSGSARARSPPRPTRELVEALARPHLEQLEREPTRGRRWVRIVARLTRTRADVRDRLGEGAFADLFA
jgi:hypothetical protein